MNSMLSELIISVWMYSFALAGCSNHAASNSSLGEAFVEKSLTAIQHVNTYSRAGTTASKDELTKIYAQSIADYIKAVSKEYKINFDTLFFGKHVYGQPDDFPDIELPEVIEDTQIRLLTPEAGMQKQKESKSSFYINLVGFVEDEKAEFIFITFSNGYAHQFDCFIQYTYHTELKAYMLENSRFENYLYKKE